MCDIRSIHGNSTVSDPFSHLAFISCRCMPNLWQQCQPSIYHGRLHRIKGKRMPSVETHNSFLLKVLRCWNNVNVSHIEPGGHDMYDWKVRRRAACHLLRFQCNITNPQCGFQRLIRAMYQGFSENLSRSRALSCRGVLLVQHLFKSDGQSWQNCVHSDHDNSSHGLSRGKNLSEQRGCDEWRSSWFIVRWFTEFFLFF